MTSKKLVVNLLGRGQIVAAGGHECRCQAKSLALLAYLAVEGRACSREHLSGFLWPALPRESARSNLRKTVFRLHQALGGDGVLLTAPEILQLDHRALRLDWTGFMQPLAPDMSLAQLKCQAELYRGPFLDGLTLPDCPDFEEWLYIQREVSHRQALALLERLGVELERAGETAEALRHTRRHLELEPWDEGAHRRAMRLLAASGQTTAALAQYDQCAYILRREQGVAPTPETQALRERIKAEQLRPERVEPNAIAERRQVTALYFGFSIADGVDPEDAAECWSAVQQSLRALIGKFGGHVSPSHGGGVLGYFGYPVAQEDAARRAVRAALAAQELGDARLRIRAGIHSGMVVARADRPDAMGLASTLAIRLQDLGRPVAISEATLRLVAGYFYVEAAGTCPSDEAAQPIAVYGVAGESGAQYRLEALDRLTPYVGREAELEALRRLWAEAKGGQSRTVLIRGEAGIGKSRLLHVFKESLTLEPHAIRELRCFPEFVQSPFQPLKVMLEGIFDFAHGDSPARRSEKLEQYLATQFAALAAEAAPLLGQLLGLPLSGRYPEPVLSPQQQKERTIAVLLDLLQALALRQPVALILEDLHWGDPSTLELLTRLLEEGRPSPVLTLLTARPEFQCSWPAGFGAILALTPLGNAEVAKMVAAIGPDIPGAIVAHILERAGGIPLFVEEMAKLAQEGGGNIPITLHDLLAAELDALGPAKRTAQLAATIGREFDPGLLREISESPPRLDELMAAGLVLHSRWGYQFKHALIQEAAYQSQAKADRQAAHRRIAEVLGARFADTPPEILAQHWAACGETALAVECWIKAGKRATAHSASAEAAANFRAGLELIPLLAVGAQRDQLEFALQAGLGVVLQAVQGYGSAAATQANARASSLSRAVTDDAELFQAKWARVMNTIAGVGSRAAIGPARELLAAVGRHGEPLRRQAAHYAVADAAFWSGDFESARHHTEQMLALYRPDQCSRSLEQFGEDLSVSCLAYLAWSSFFLGFPARASQVCRQMLHRARQLAHPHTLALALCFASVLHRWMGRAAETLVLSAETIAVSREHGFPVWLAAGEMTHGWAQVRQGGNETGIVELQSSIAGMREAIRGISVVFLSALIEAYVALRRPAEALAVIADAMDDVDRSGDGHFTAELWRLQGECRLMLSSGNRAEAADCFARALGLSRRQNSTVLELRAAMSLARHFKDVKPLAEVYSRFDEGFDSPDLVEAAGLVEPESLSCAPSGLPDGAAA